MSRHPRGTGHAFLETSHYPRNQFAPSFHFSSPFLWAIFFFGCGTQGPPRPPRLERPEKIADLAVTQMGRALELRFTAPALATDGERLRKPIEIEIFRAVASSAREAPATLETIQPWVRLLGADLRHHTVDEKIEYSAALSQQEFNQSVNSTLTFAVRALTRGYRRRPVEGELSNVVQVALLDATAPIESLSVRTTEHALELTWAVPSNCLSGRPAPEPGGYRVYRSEKEGPGAVQLRGETQSPAFSDVEFVFGHTYTYKIRSVVRIGTVAAESEDSQPVRVTPLDVFPPAAPARLTAVYSTGVVELVWTANTEPDLAGYNVYRRGEQSPRQRVNGNLVPTPVYRDAAVEAGQKLFYSVTAVDLAGNESPASEEVLVESR